MSNEYKGYNPPLRDESGIIEVYEDNFVTEIKKIGSLLSEYNYIGMDTEFPGTVYELPHFTQDFYYQTMKLNVDSLKLIQLGITLSNKNGEFPQGAHTWQFNLNFDYSKDKYATSSINLLVNCGIDFKKLKKKGINHQTFAEYLMVSGLVLNPNIHWVSFHGSYDFGYLLQLLLNSPLPLKEEDFTKDLSIYFPSHYDIRILVQGNEHLQGGLNRLADILEVFRVGKTHQAGSDSVVTIDVFFKLIKNNLVESDCLIRDENILFGLGQGADDEETIGYTPFANDNMYIPNNMIVNENGFNPHSMMNMVSYGENKKYQYANKIGKVMGNRIAVN